MDERELPQGAGPLDPRLSRLVELAERGVEPPTVDQLTRRWHKLRWKLARGARPRRAAFAVAVAAALALAFGGTLALRGRTAKLAYDVDGGTVVSDGHVQQLASDGATLRFSDGTNVALASRTRMKVCSTQADGPKMQLEDGEARVRVFHREGTRWLFDAGPFSIVVKGTSFVVRWSESDKWLRLHLRSGAVAVSGPLPSGDLVVREGQQLSVRLREGEILLRDDEESGPPEWDRQAPVPTNAAPSPEPAEPTAETREPEHPSPTNAPRHRDDGARNWSHKLAMGKVAQILEEAQALGDGAIEETTSADLEALADAARYSAKDDLARRALLAQRRRFPSGARAAKAAFFLGRLEEAAARPAKALEWYDGYLREAPSGSYASEAMGSKMGVLSRVYGRDRARPVAEEYLHRFPGGSYAAAAQALTARP